MLNICLLVVDLISNFPVIHQCKSIFAEYGIPEEFISDNGPCYDSKKFADFAEEYRFTHTTSSPNNPEGNGFAERYVGIMKDILNKAKEEKKDPYFALLQYRITPLGKGKPSPMEMLNRRRYFNLPTSYSRKVQSSSIDEVDLRKGPKHDPVKLCQQPNPWKAGTPVMVRDTHKKIWQKGVIHRIRPEPNSYDVEIKGVIYRRTKQHIKLRIPTEDETPQHDDVDDAAQGRVQPQRVRKAPQRLITE